MRNTRLPNSVFLALVCVAAIQAVYYDHRLPPVLGSHFVKDGSVNAWQTHAQFFTLELIVIALSAFVAFAVPRTFSLLPPHLINLPNKDYWLAPERRDQTFAYLQSQMAWFGCALLAFLLFTMELVFRANLQTPPRLNSTALSVALIIFLTVAAFLVIHMIRSFYRKPPLRSA